MDERDIGRYKMDVYTVPQHMQLYATAHKLYAINVKNKLRSLSLHSLYHVRNNSHSVVGCCKMQFLHCD